MDAERFARATRLRDSGRLHDAIRELDAMFSAAENPTDRALLLLNKIPCLIRLGQVQDGRLELEAAIRENPTDPFLRPQFKFVEALLDGSENRESECIAKLDKLLADFRDDLTTPALRYLYEDIQLRRAFYMVKRARYREAEPLLEEALSFDLSEEDGRILLCNVAFCRQKLGNYESARQFYTRAVESGVPPAWQGTVQYNLGVVYYRLGCFAQAKEQFKACEQRAAAYKYPLDNIYQWLSSTCKQLGEPTEAQEYARLAKPT